MLRATATFEEEAKKNHSVYFLFVLFLFFVFFQPDKMLCFHFRLVFREFITCAF